MPGKTVLIIDDDADFRKTLAATLRQVGYNALEAADGQQAIRTIEQLRTTIDLMIVDLALPAVSGLEIIGSVTRRKTPIKIVATSGVFDNAYLEMVKGVGADESIHKRAVAHPEKWLEIVRRLVGEAGEPEPPSKRMVLVVDDEAPIRGYIRAILHRHGIQVLEAADGVDAIGLVERLGGAVDVIVTDVKMPRMNGPEFVKAVRADYPNIPVVFISGELDQNLHRPQQRMVLVGKPFVPQVLLDAIMDALPNVTGRSA